MRWPTPLHKIATETAARNNRSLNEQVMEWLEHGGMPLEHKTDQLNALKIKYADLLIMGNQAPGGLREMAYAQAEDIRAKIEALS